MVLGIAGILYLLAAGIIFYNHRRQQHEASILSWGGVLIAWIIQSMLLYHQLFNLQEASRLTINLTLSMELAAWITGLLYVVGWWTNRTLVRSVGMVLLPLMALLLFAAQISPISAHHTKTVTPDGLLGIHLFLAFLAYGLFCIAAILALLDAFQAHALKQKRFGPFFSTIPSLTRLEVALFRVVQLGFLSLTLSIITGMLHFHLQYDVWLIFNHKVVFSLSAWVVMALLLGGRYIYGWRGRNAVRMVLIGYGFLVLAFLGVKFVAEIILPHIRSP
ncbi:cytochrome C assembly family protein [Magnetococcales bacterium HHB-1]